VAITAKPRPVKDRTERWLLTYADLITLLMVFFVILYSFSIIDIRKFYNLKGSLTEAFHQGVLSGVSASGINETVSGSSVQEQLQPASESTKASLATQLQTIAEASGLGEAVTVTTNPEGVTVSLAANLLFQSGTSDLKPGALELIGQIAPPLRQIQYPIEVVAHTDDLPPAPTNSLYKDNWQVGAARASSVLRALTGPGQLPESRLSTGNYGQYDPLFPNDSPENRAKNRRVDVIIVFPTPDLQPIAEPFQIPPAVAPPPVIQPGAAQARAAQPPAQLAPAAAASTNPPTTAASK
jgi:chemotaxis protein MotB